MTEQEAIAHRRRNANSVNDGTARGRLYARLLHVQIDCQEAGDEETEELLCEILDDWTGWHKGPQPVTFASEATPSSGAALPLAASLPARPGERLGVPACTEQHAGVASPRARRQA